MKTRNLLTLGAVILAVMTFNVSGALLSPRATGNEIIRFAGTNSDSNLVALGMTSAEYATPREVGNKAVAVAGANKEVNPSTLCSQNMAGSPKAIQACAANPTAPMPCCAVAAK